jgi:hypothetical protein
MAIPALLANGKILDLVDHAHHVMLGRTGEQKDLMWQPLLVLIVLMANTQLLEHLCAQIAQLESMLQQMQLAWQAAQLVAEAHLPQLLELQLQGIVQVNV